MVGGNSRIITIILSWFEYLWGLINTNWLAKLHSHKLISSSSFKSLFFEFFWAQVLNDTVLAPHRMICVFECAFMLTWRDGITREIENQISYLKAIPYYPLIIWPNWNVSTHFEKKLFFRDWKKRFLKKISCKKKID